MIYCLRVLVVRDAESDFFVHFARNGFVVLEKRKVSTALALGMPTDSSAGLTFHMPLKEACFHLYLPSPKGLFRGSEEIAVS